MKRNSDLSYDLVLKKNNLLKISKNILKKEWVWLGGIFVLFLLLRVFCWTHATELEEPDSVSYLNLARVLKNHQWDRLKPTDNLFYSFLIVVVNWFGLSLEFSARLICLLSSVLLFFAIFFLGKKIIGIKSTLLTLLIFSFSPFYINFSISVLSDPSYLGLVFLGFVLFRYFLEKPNLKIALLIGFIFGLSFSDRTEGIIFLLLIPFFQLLHFVFWRNNRYSFSKLILFTIVYMFGYSLIAVPVIFRVSNQMGTFSINGRTAWEKLLKYQGSESYTEKLYGLDFSEGEINLYYILKHPEELDKITNSESLYNKLHFSIYNVSELFRSQLSSLIGIFVIFFSGIGIYFLFYENKIMDLSILLLFVLIVLIPPMWLNDYLTRHIALVGPIFMLQAGFGVYRFSDSIQKSINKKKLNRNWTFLQLSRNKISIFLLGVMILLSLGWINKSIRYPSQNEEYNINNFSKPLAVIKRDIINEKIINPKIVSWHEYFPYFANIESFVVPYTDYEGLIRYCKLNKINYLFLEYERLKDYPFLNNFKMDKHPEFILLSSQIFSNGKKIELYKF